MCAGGLQPQIKSHGRSISKGEDEGGREHSHDVRCKLESSPRFRGGESCSKGRSTERGYPRTGVRVGFVDHTVNISQQEFDQFDVNDSVSTKSSKILLTRPRCNTVGKRCLANILCFSLGSSSSRRRNPVARLSLPI